jgi:hypothetical protein
MERVVRGVGRIGFRLEYGGILEVDGVLFVPWLRVNLLLVSALEDAGYSTLFKRGGVFIYREGVDLVEPKLIGDQMDRLYMMRGQPTGDDSESDEEQEAPKTAVVRRVQSCILREERESLQSIDRRLSWCERTKAQSGRMDFLRSSGFRVVASRMISGLSYVQVLRLAPGSEGAPTENNVMGPDDGDGSEYIPY